MKKTACSLVASMCFAISGSSASATDKMPVLDTYPIEYVERVEALLTALGSGGDAGAARGIYIAAAVWPKQYRKLRVCFFGGTEEARSLIAEHAMDWMRPEHAMVFDFGEPGKHRTCEIRERMEAQIRIGFDEKSGWWSALGSDSVVMFPQFLPSMNLAYYADLTRDKWNDALSHTLRHELGHALALMHEHQNPNSPCEEEFDWEKIYKAPSDWTKEMIDSNLRRLVGDQYVSSPFDVKSIMLYVLPAEFFKTGDKAKCYIAQPNLHASDGDLQEIIKLYPLDEAERTARSEKVRAEFEALWSKAEPKMKNAVPFDPIKAYFERPQN